MFYFLVVTKLHRQNFMIYVHLPYGKMYGYFENTGRVKQYVVIHSEILSTMYENYQIFLELEILIFKIQLCNHRMWLFLYLSALKPLKNEPLG